MHHVCTVYHLAAMGTSRRHRQAFFNGHPLCCFCGGSSPAVEIDHIPARSLFGDRQWPEGYEFPACSGCNRESRIDELALGWLLRVKISEPTDRELDELEAALGKLHRRRPEWVRQLKELSRNETRRYLAERGLPRTLNGKELYVVEVPPIIMGAAERYARKIGKALFYMHTGEHFPTLGHISVQVFSNGDVASQHFPADRFRQLNGRPVVSRSGKDLSSQFTYRYGIAPDNEAAAFLTIFGESSAMVTLLFKDAEKYRREWGA